MAYLKLMNLPDCNAWEIVKRTNAYPVYGYLGMAAMLLVAEHAVHARRVGNNSAATGD